ncbi:MAG: ABC transporter substrate-binding protein [Gammaproteobacteria bacterium]|nr:ABC transporter substrate-binding protein [Gammaproteobacteria bacterium]
MMKWFSKTIMSLMVVFFANVSVAKTAPTLDMKDPYQLIHNVAEQTFARFKTDRALIDKDLNHLKVVVEQELMPYINTKYALAKVLGKNYRKLSKAQKTKFTAVFYDYLIVNYANMFTLYDQQQVTYGKTKKFANKKTVSVKVKIIDTNRPPISIAFKLRKGAKSGNWKAYDMSAEGVSMVASKHAEFNALIRKHGIDYVIDYVAKKSNDSVELKVKK